MLSVRCSFTYLAWELAQPNTWLPLMTDKINESGFYIHTYIHTSMWFAVAYMQILPIMQVSISICWSFRPGTSVSVSTNLPDRSKGLRNPPLGNNTKSTSAADEPCRGQAYIPSRSEGDRPPPPPPSPRPVWGVCPCAIKRYQASGCARPRGETHPLVRSHVGKQRPLFYHQGRATAMTNGP